QNRYITVPRGNVEFDIPVISSASASLGTDFNATITVTNVNPGTSVQGTASVAFKPPGSGSAVLKIPLSDQVLRDGRISNSCTSPFGAADQGRHADSCNVALRSESVKAGRRFVGRFW